MIGAVAIVAVFAALVVATVAEGVNPLGTIGGLVATMIVGTLLIGGGQ